MRLLRTTSKRLVFHLGKREKQLLAAILKLYPRVPSTHQPLSKAGGVPEPESTQRLLDEALAEQRAERRRQVASLLADPKRLKEVETGWRLSISPVDVEWLLQVLNDVRVGSWVILGSPEERLEVLDEHTVPHVWAMETAGLFQQALLEALEHPD